MPEDARRVASASISHRIRALPCFADARTVLGYRPVGAEADPGSPFFSTANERLGMLVPLGSAATDEPRWHAVAGVDRSGVPGDPPRAARELAYPVVVIVPGVGFDRTGMRLGRGTGFYDRALAELREAGPVHAIGLAFECQIAACLPSDSWDQRVDLVASEARVWHATAAGGRAAAAP